MIPALCRDVYFLRLAVVAERTTSEDIRFSFEVIKTCADKVLRSSRDFKQDEPVVVDIDLSRKKALWIIENQNIQMIWFYSVQNKKEIVIIKVCSEYVFFYIMEVIGDEH